LGENMIRGKRKMGKRRKKRRKRGGKREREKLLWGRIKTILILIFILYLYFPPMFMIFWREKIYTPVITL